MGFREPITRDRLREATRTGEIEQLVNWVPVKAGEDVISYPRTQCTQSARVSCCLRSSRIPNVTYRLWDYGRPRELHIDRAVPVCDLTVHAGPAETGGAQRHQRPAREVEAFRDGPGARARRRTTPGSGCRSVLALHLGDGAIAEEPYKPGDVFVSNGDPVRAHTDSRFLRTWKP
jgi:mannose-6-phosphate isomerase